MSDERRKNTPKSSVIYKYWLNKGLPPAKGNETIPLEEYTCFACGIFFSIERCHIIPLWNGGDNTPNNIHLLCKGCHANSEGNVHYWNWLTYMRKNEWKFRWEWAIKILERNGVNIEFEANKCEKINFKERLKFIRTLLKDNGINVKSYLP